MIADLRTFFDTFRGRLVLMGVAIAMTFTVFGTAATAALRARAAESNATLYLLEAMRLTDDARGGLQDITNAMAMVGNTRDPGLLNAADAINVALEDSLARLGAFVADDAHLSALHAELMDQRAIYLQAGESVLALMIEGRFDEASRLTEAPAFFEASGSYLRTFDIFMQEVQDEARASYERTGAQTGGVLLLAGLGFVVVVILWGAIVLDWAIQTSAARRAQSKLADMNDDLERRVQQRTAELDEARVRAEQANHAKSEFLAAMSHELRTPLNGVLGMATVLQRQNLTDAQREMLEVIETSGRSLLALLNDVLDYARLEAGQMQLRAEPFELTPLLERTLARHRAAAAEKGLPISLDVAEEAESVFIGDEARIAQAVGNLVSNAVKFTDAGAVDIQATGSGDSVRITVRDTGCGVQPDMMQSIFERFQQGDSSSRRRHGGAGLGLALTHDLVKAMGGRIGVESTPGQGALFWVDLTLPRWVPAAERDGANDDSRQVA